jgi:hypothetical protein
VQGAGNANTNVIRKELAPRGKKKKEKLEKHSNV